MKHYEVKCVFPTFNEEGKVVTKKPIVVALANSFGEAESAALETNDGYVEASAIKESNIDMVKIEGDPVFGSYLFTNKTKVETDEGRMKLITTRVAVVGLPREDAEVVAKCFFSDIGMPEDIAKIEKTEIVGYVE